MLLLNLCLYIGDVTFHLLNCGINFFLKQGNSGFFIWLDLSVRICMGKQWSLETVANLGSNAK